VFTDEQAIILMWAIILANIIYLRTVDGYSTDSHILPLGSSSIHARCSSCHPATTVKTMKGTQC